MKIEKGMIIRTLHSIGRHKEGFVFKVVDVAGSLAFAVNLKNKTDKMILYRYSELVEEIGKGGFYV